MSSSIDIYSPAGKCVATVSGNSLDLTIQGVLVIGKRAGGLTAEAVAKGWTCKVSDRHGPVMRNCRIGPPSPEYEVECASEAVRFSKPGRHWRVVHDHMVARGKGGFVPEYRTFIGIWRRVPLGWFSVGHLAFRTIDGAKGWINATQSPRSARPATPPGEKEPSDGERR